jgi:hypothetical protein
MNRPVTHRLFEQSHKQSAFPITRVGVPPIDPAMLAKINGGDAWDDDAAADRALNPFIGWIIAIGFGTLVWALVFFVVTL